jgi:hypothetical protein
MKKFKVIIQYYDSGTRKEHSVEFIQVAENEIDALSQGQADFNRYQTQQSASWIRMIRSYQIIPLEGQV